MMIITKIGEILVEVCGDSTAAIAFASRRGLGTPKRMMTKTRHVLPIMRSEVNLHC